MLCLLLSVLEELNASSLVFTRKSGFTWLSLISYCALPLSCPTPVLIFPSSKGDGPFYKDDFQMHHIWPSILFLLLCSPLALPALRTQLKFSCSEFHRIKPALYPSNSEVISDWLFSFLLGLPLSIILTFHCVSFECILTLNYPANFLIYTWNSKISLVLSIWNGLRKQWLRKS
jgi:hypothetical protein